ncbi:MAG: hypothetical protein GY697_15600 [Desulfobacterales bacterium]|nr:hypothetical protein [Desulfobacterales bacterium]
MKTKPTDIPTIIVLVGLVLLTLLASGTQNHASAAGQSGIINGDKAMLAEKQDYQIDAAVPSIDAKAPAELETATFGLG